MVQVLHLDSHAFQTVCNWSHLSPFLGHSMWFHPITWIMFLSIFSVFVYFSLLKLDCSWITLMSIKLKLNHSLFVFILLHQMLSHSLRLACGNASWFLPPKMLGLGPAKPPPTPYPLTTKSLPLKNKHRCYIISKALFKTQLNNYFLQSLE